VNDRQTVNDDPSNPMSLSINIELSSISFLSSHTVLLRIIIVGQEDGHKQSNDVGNNVC
jgi:hypothetical protein